MPLLVLVALAWPGLDATTPDVHHALQPPSLAHPFGTDPLGRDLFSRVVLGTVPSLGAALTIVGTASVTGTLLGVVAGLRGGLLDLVVLRVADMFLAFPGIVLALVIAGALEGGLSGAVVAICLVLWPTYTRLARDQARLLRHAPFVLAAHGLGASVLHTLRRHVLPHLADVLLVQASMDVAGAIGLIAGLSAIGVGVEVGTPEWGMLITEGTAYLAAGCWWLALFPTLALLLVCGGWVLISDGLRDWRSG